MGTMLAGVASLLAVGLIMLLVQGVRMFHRIERGARAELPQRTDREAVDLAPLIAACVGSRLPACAAAVLVDGELRGIGVAGVRRRGGDDPATIDDRFHLGSCGKAMTATLAAILVAEGRLRWTTTAGEALGAVAGTFAGATLEELLAHRAGAPGDVGDIDRRAWPAFMRGDPPDAVAQREAMVRLLAGRRPRWRHGSRFAYANLGYVLSGRMIEVAGGAPFETLMRQRLFAPLGMASAGFGPPTRIDPAQPHGHQRMRAVPDAVADNPLGYAPAGTIHASIADWAAFVRCHLRAEGPILPHAGSWRELQRARGDRHALGWMRAGRAWARGEALTHAGSNTAWYCRAWMAPSARFATLVACNQGDGGAAGAIDEVTQALIRRFAPR